MKKIFKLRTEILIIFFISAVISFVVTAVFYDLYRELSFEQSRLQEGAEKRNETHIDNLNHILDIDSKDEETIKRNMDENQRELIQFGADSLYLLRADGTVIKSFPDDGVRKIDFEDKESSMKIVNIRFVARNVLKVNDDFYIVATVANYCTDDFNKVTTWLIITIIVFIILMRGRIKYLNVISKKVREISDGDLNIKIPKKYSNELTILSEDINIMTENLKAEDLKQKEFITNISHDLRTPLTTVLGYLKMIEDRKYDNEEELQSYLSIINRKSNYLKGLLDDFFDYSKLMSKDIEVNMTEININECIKELLFEEEKNFTDNNLVLISEIEENTIRINGDPMLIFRVFENLFSNAVKYSKSNTEVLIKLFTEDNNMVFKIMNIPKDKLTYEDVKNFFNRLYKKDKSRKSVGNGLGLAITKEIVNLHKGNIKAYIEGEKLIFTLRIPKI